ncbi:MAG TPA: XRE family transcriptional regulator [Rhodospirillales bacterium]|nr:XRE family transcriptional regulator [Rhodospirillales bacterium]
MTKTPQSQEVSPLDSHLGRRIALRRQQLNMSAADLEKAISMVPGSVARFEAGRQSLNATQLFALSRALDVPVLYFFEGLSTLNNNTSVEVPAAEYITEAERFLDAYFKIADDKVRGDILGLMKAAAGEQEENA